jgi:ankyrin repeat protein
LTSLTLCRFRWAYCQLDSIKKLKLKRPGFIKKTLHDLPKDLDETYERMLLQFDPIYQETALRALRWLAYTVEPLTIAELNEACLVDPEGSAENALDVENRGPFENLLDLLENLVLVEDPADHRDHPLETDTIGRRPERKPPESYPIGDLFIRLAHFSVQEYLVSARIALTAARPFALQFDRDRHLLLKSSVAYIEYCMHALQLHVRVTPFDCKVVFEREPLEPLIEELVFLHCAIQDWYRYTSSNDPNETRQVMRVLNNDIFVRLEEFTLYRVSSFRKTRTPRFRLCLIDEESYKCRIFEELTGKSEFFMRGIWFKAVIAVKTGLPAALKLLLVEGADVNGHWGQLDPLLHYACGRRQYRTRPGRVDAFWTPQISLEMVKLLLDAGANINARDREGSPALCVACEEDLGDTAQFMVEQGADVNLYTCSDRSALHFAAETGDVKLLRVLLVAGVELEHHGRSAKWNGSALYFACYHGRTDAVRLLLGRGADVNGAACPIEDNSSLTYPLAATSYCGHPGVVQVLLQYHADVPRTSPEFGSALDAAIAGLDAMSPGSSADRDSLITLLLAAGAAVNPADPSHGTPLTAAAQSNNLAAARQLLALGANVDRASGHAKHWSRDDDRQSIALGYAIGREITQIVQLLLEHGANLDICVLHDKAFDVRTKRSVEPERCLFYEAAIDRAVRARTDLSQSFTACGLDPNAFDRLKAIDHIIVLLSEARKSREQKTPELLGPEN